MEWPQYSSYSIFIMTTIFYIEHDVHCLTSNKKSNVSFTKKCNVRQSALQKFLKISIKNSKCATSNKHIQDGRPGRYENRRGSKNKGKTPQERPNPPPRNENVRDVITQKAWESGIRPSDSKRTGFWQKSAKWDHCAPKMRNDARGRKPMIATEL